MIYHRLFLLLFTTVLYSCTSNGESGEEQADSDRIVGGVQAIRDLFPYQVSLKTRAYDFQHSCGGVLVSLDYVLTAAHCVHFGDTASNPKGKLMKPKDIYVVAGEYSLQQKDPPEQRRSVSKIISHKSYEISRTEIKNDLALLKLTKPMDFNKQIVESLAIASPEYESLGLAVASGWGAISGGDEPEYPDVLRYTMLRILLPEHCWDPTGKVLCTKGDYNNNACYGDSRGPLGCYDFTHGRFFLCGIASYVTPANCTGSHNAGYVRVASYNDWLSVNTDGVVVPQEH